MEYLEYGDALLVHELLTLQIPFLETNHNDDSDGLSDLTNTGRNAVGQEGLQITLGNGHIDIVNLLVGSGAVGNGHIDVVKLLVDNGADVNAEPSSYGGRTPLQEAAKCGYMGIVGLLLSEKTLSQVDIEVEQPCKQQLKVGTLTLLTCSCPRERWSTPNHPRFKVGRLAERGHTEIVKAVLSKGADLNNAAPGHEDGRSVLMCAVYSGDLEILKILLGYGASVDSGLVLQYAVEMQYTDITELLLDNGATSML